MTQPVPQTDVVSAAVRTAAGEVVRMLPPSGDAESDTARAQAAALFRVLAEVDKEWAGGVRLLRTNDRELWAFESEATAQATRALGKAADELAARPALAAMGEARRVLGDAVEGTPLAALKDERLFDLAARASAHAACSARFELYPRGLDGRRALELCAATLKSGTQPGVSEADVRERVAARYPEAAPLPARPLLDAYLEPLGFRWDEGSARYLRLGEGHPTTLATAHTSFARAPTGLPTQPRAMDEGAIGARQFGEKLKHAIEMNAFRVLGVASNHAQDAAVQLAARLDAELVAFDVELAKEVALQIRKANIKDDDVIHSADRAGPTGEHWSKLVTLVQLAAKALAARLLPNTRPLVLVQPGPIQRYGLADFLRRLVEVGADRETPAIFLLVPNHDTGGLPRINGTMPIAGIVPGQTLWVSKTWLENRDNAAA